MSGGSIMSASDGRLEITYFLERIDPPRADLPPSESAAAPDGSPRITVAEILSVAVVWRHPGPLLDATSQGTSVKIQQHVPLAETWTEPTGWSSVASGQNGERAALLSHERRVVRVLDEEIPLGAPDTATVLLVDEETRPGERPTIVVRRVPVAPLPAVVIDLAASREKRSSDTRARKPAERAACLAAIRQDPDVRAFLDWKPTSA